MSFFFFPFPGSNGAGSSPVRAPFPHFQDRRKERPSPPSPLSYFRSSRGNMAESKLEISDSNYLPPFTARIDMNQRRESLPFFLLSERIASRRFLSLARWRSSFFPGRQRSRRRLTPGYSVARIYQEAFFFFFSTPKKNASLPRARRRALFSSFSGK